LAGQHAWLTVAALFTALTAPLFNYIGDKKKEELITVNKSTWGLANNTDSLTNEEILEVGSQDPNIIAPFLLYNLNEQKSYSIPMKKIAAIYPVMYKLNTNQADKSFFESIVFSFISDNKSVIEDQLFTNFNRQVEHSNLNNESVRLDVLTTYVTIIYNCMLQNDKRFIAEKSVIQKQSEGSGGHIYKIILGIISAK